MRIIGKCVEDFGCRSLKLYKGPYPTWHPDLSEIDGSKAYGSYHHGHNHSRLLQFVRGERDICFYPNLHLPFITSHCLSKFVVSHDSFPSGIKDFDATFTTSDGKKITKEYQMGKLSSFRYFWQDSKEGDKAVYMTMLKLLRRLIGQAVFMRAFGSADKANSKLLDKAGFTKRTRASMAFLLYALFGEQIC
ncbi:hypothetical protein ADUPG1_011169 [Aduncisulcus paluster]|uniref:Uncharacterized protein n=1 Tax=Aduncisulcus paluster TaxID=2918883 RepID=A0ABQ5JUU2_9EUKA|nr:hypothetical protein ADUPG1_011169 [Aduncisulcus paluster]